MYGLEDKKSVDYDLNYFFQQNGDNYNYVMKTSEELSKDSYMPISDTGCYAKKCCYDIFQGSQANKRSAECGLI